VEFVPDERSFARIVMLWLPSPRSFKFLREFTLTVVDCPAVSAKLFEENETLKSPEDERFMFESTVFPLLVMLIVAFWFVVISCVLDMLKE
jgi:hypothetical protein